MTKYLWSLAGGSEGVSPVLSGKARSLGLSLWAFHPGSSSSSPIVNNTVFKTILN